MSRDEMIRLLVLNEIADDYEESKHIHERITDRVRGSGLNPEAKDIESALLGLVEFGLAKVYHLSTTAPASEVTGLPTTEELRQYYFLITERGLGMLRKWRAQWWPFDDEGNYAGPLLMG